MNQTTIPNTHRSLSYKTYLALVLPLTISTITVPLLGAVDTALIGHLPDPAFIAGVAVSVVIFNTLYWLFGFLRVSTTGFTAQALDDGSKLREALFRPLALAVILGLIFILFQNAIFSGAMKVSNPEPLVRHNAKLYYDILIWGAPFTLINYVFLGYLMGRAKAKAILFVQVFINLLNICLAVLFVWGLKLEVKGVAYATLIAQIVAVALGFYLVKQNLPKATKPLDIKQTLSLKALKNVMLVNGDLMIRTICLLIVTNHFIATSSSLGTDTLAANSVLFQIHYLMAYIYDGFANAASVFSGKAKGQKNISLYNDTLRCGLISCFSISFTLMFIWAVADNWIIGLFTNQTVIIELCQQYAIWLLFFPLLSSAGLIYYGVFTGISYTSSVRNSMIMSLIAWYIGWYLFVPYYQNHGLWIAYLAFSLGRSLFLIIYIPKSKKYIAG